MERSDTTTTTGAKDGATTGRRRANRFSVLVDRGGVVVDRVRDAFLSVQSDGTITTTTKKKKKKKKKKRRKAEDDEKDDAVVVLFSARRETTRRNEEEETTAIENAVWPRELVREEEAMREKDREKDFDFDGEEDFVVSLAKNELFRNFSAETRGFAVFNFIIFIMGSNIVLVKMAQENISPDAFGLFPFPLPSFTLCSLVGPCGTL